MITAADLLASACAIARDKKRTDAERAWHRYEERMWYDAHMERGLRLSDIPSEFRDGVFNLIKLCQPTPISGEKK